jgi:hypothetical protein
VHLLTIVGNKTLFLLVVPDDASNDGHIPTPMEVDDDHDHDHDDDDDEDDE